MTRRVVGWFVVAGGVLALGVLAVPPVAALPAEPAAPCLPDGTCLPDAITDPCAPVNGVDPCAPCTDPSCLVGVPELPAEVPTTPADTPGLPVSGVTPGAPTANSPGPVTADAPAGGPEAPVPQTGDSSEDALPDPGRSSGGTHTPPVSIPTSSASNRAAAVAHAARSFVVLFALAGLVGVYLIVQGRVDRRDPKLAAAPVDGDAELLRFE